MEERQRSSSPQEFTAFLNRYIARMDHEIKTREGSIGKRKDQLTIHAYVVPADAPDSTMNWSTTGGTLSATTLTEGNRRERTWTAPDARGLATITVTVLGNTGTLVRTGHTFAGWNTKADGSGTDYVANATFTMGSANVTLYAKWTANPTYNLTYNNLQGGSRASNPTTYTTESLPITLVSGTNSAWAFVGWYDNDQFTGTALTVLPAGTTGNKGLYAKWKMDLFEGKPGHTNSTYFGRRLAYNSANGHCYILDGTTIKHYNGTDWQALPTSGMPNVTTDYGAAIAVDSQNNVYYLIESTTSGMTGAYCTKWNGTSWSNLGNQGFGNSTAKAGGTGYTPQIAITTDGTVYPLTTKDGCQRTIFRLNGGTWQDISPPSLYGGTMYIDGNTVYVTYFNSSGGSTYLSVRSWNGDAWSQVGDTNITNAAAWGSYHYVAARNGYVVVAYRDSSTSRIACYRKTPDSNAWTSLGNPTTADSAKITQGTTGYLDLGIYNNYPVVFTPDSRIIKHNGTAWQELSQTTTASGGGVYGTIDHTNGFAWMFIGSSGTTPAEYVKKQNLN
jgi:uncharacterized repeat protein (TIGR02543 family)